MRKSLRILGTRGIPGGHGGFETFAENLALFLVQRGWAVTVYCQLTGGGRTREDTWRGVRRIVIPVTNEGSRGTVLFDWMSTRHALSEDGLALVLGYNTAVFISAFRLFQVPSLLNLDGLESRRQKYNALERAWFIANEWVGVRVADHLIADHPEIEARYRRQVASNKMSTVPYGADAVLEADPRVLDEWKLSTDGYALVIARPVPENSILEIVNAFGRCSFGGPLVILGNYDRENPYHRRVLDSAGADVRFVGPLYERRIVNALRLYAALYIHGHQVGGTNPSLVEALGAGCPVLAHDNRFNRWTCGSAAAFFRNEDDLVLQLQRLLGDTGQGERQQLRVAARARHASTFEMAARLADYETVLLRLLAGTSDQPLELVTTGTAQ